MRLTYGSLDLTDTPYLIEFGSDFGAPQNMTEALAFLLQDGEVELSSRASNRTLQFNVLIEGDTLTDLADAEAALVLESEKPLNTITVDPEDSAPASVYEVFRGQVVFVHDDAWEQVRKRRYTVTVSAAPFVRSEDEVTTPALPTSGTTTTTLDTCSATTGWTGFANGVSTTVSNLAGINSVTSGSNVLLAMQKTFAATTTTTNLLMVDWDGLSGDSQTQLVAKSSGVELARIGTTGGGASTSGRRTYFLVPTSTLTVLRLELTNASYLGIGNVAVTDIPPIFGTKHQQLRKVAVEGSARAAAALAIEAASTSALSETLVYVYPDDGRAPFYSPALRQYHSGGNAPFGGGTMSGTLVTLNSSGEQLTIGAAFLPSGSYLLMARIGGHTGVSTGRVNVAASTVVGSTLVNSTSLTSPTFSLGSDSYQVVVLGTLDLPTVDLPSGSSASVRLTLTQSLDSGANIAVDEAWLFHRTLGRLTWVDCGGGVAAVGGPSKRLFIEPADIRTPRPTVRVGHSADRSDSFFPTTVKSWQAPEFQPPSVNVFVATEGAADAAVSMRHTPAWHTHAAS